MFFLLKLKYSEEQELDDMDNEYSPKDIALISSFQLFAGATTHPSALMREGFALLIPRKFSYVDSHINWDIL